MISKRHKHSRQIAIMLVSGLLACCSHQNGDPAEVVALMPAAPVHTKAQGSKGQYRVAPGDTLWQIAQLYHCSVTALAKRNQLQPPYSLYPGQLLTIGEVPQAIQKPQREKKCKPEPQCTGVPLAKATPASPAVAAPPKQAAPPPESLPLVVPSAALLQWQWPTQGKVIELFSSANGGNRGIDIAGTLGQAIYSSAAGRVVYAGNALQGYGYLLIIKHTEDWLTAYAHNDKLLVHEQQLIKAGQKIATMGSSGTHSVRLHFQIRYQGKSVNPLHYLPKR